MFQRMFAALTAVVVSYCLSSIVSAQVPTPTISKPPELTKLEAKAAVQIPIPIVPPGKAPEVKRVAEAAVKVARASWVVEKLLPPPPEGTSSLRLAEMKVGNTGWLDLTGEVLKNDQGVAVVRPSIAPSSDFTVAIPMENGVTVPRQVALRGEYRVDKAVTVDGKEMLLLKEMHAAKALDPALARVVDAARRRLETAKAEYARAVANLVEARKKAETAALEKVRGEAAKRIPVPKDASAEEQIKAKRDQDALARKLASKELEKIEASYSDQK